MGDERGYAPARRGAVIVASLLVATTAAGCGRTPAPVEGQDWVVVWEDSFDYPSVEAMGEVWQLSPPHATYHPGEVTLTANPDQPDDRIVRLTTGPFQAFDNGTWDIAQISTAGPRAPQGSEPDYPDANAWLGPLYVEAYVRYTENRHTWPAFWMFSLHKVESWETSPHDECSSPPQPWELSAEWDIMENGFGVDATTSRYFSDIHRNTPDGTADGWCGVADSTNKYSEDLPDGVVGGDWHLWAGYWRPDGQLCTYMDERLLRCGQAPDSFLQPMVLNFTIRRIPGAWCFFDTGGCPPLPSELTIEISHVRVLKAEA
jgi:hypothetical protein